MAAALVGEGAAETERDQEEKVGAADHSGEDDGGSMHFSASSMGETLTFVSCFTS